MSHSMLIYSAIIVNAVTAAGENYFSGDNVLHCFVKGAFGGLSAGLFMLLAQTLLGVRL